jgi:fido (protein-threonine AMPylation protein)
MNRAETLVLQSATDAFFRRFDEDHRFTAEDLCEMHRTRLEGIYPWAGQYRRERPHCARAIFARAIFIDGSAGRIAAARFQPGRGEAPGRVLRRRSGASGAPSPPRPSARAPSQTGGSPLP